MFQYSELRELEHKEPGQPMKACPHCGSFTYGLLDYPVDEYFLIYKNKRFHNKDKMYNKNIKHYNIYEFINEDDFE